MKTTIDTAGRLVIPRQIRRQAGLHPGMPLEVRYQEGRVEIEPAAAPIRLVKKGRLLVAVPEAVRLVRNKRVLVAVAEPGTVA